MASIKLIGYLTICALIVEELVTISVYAGSGVKFRNRFAKEEKLSPLDEFLQDDLPIILGQKPNNKFGTKPQFRDYAIKDKSNINIDNFSVQQLITRAGFKFKNHYVLADDGYITQLTRIINPLADHSLLKQPPIMLTHGGTINPTVYIWGSNIQHHPEPYPRLPEHGPITSWNRSLAFMLANNGYDVWLIGTRGSSRQNQGHVKLKNFAWRGNNSKFELSRKLNTTVMEISETHQYYDFCIDDIIEFEFPRQIDKVLEVTGAKKINFVSYSISTQEALSFFSSRPDYAKFIHNHVVMAPIVNNLGASRQIKALHSLILTLDHTMGVALFNEILFSQPMRDLLERIGKDRKLRYSIIKVVTTLAFGASAKYNTLLDDGTVGHMLENTGFKVLKQYAQQAVAGRLQKFDYGFIKNEIIYGQPFPPVYNITNQHIDNWLLVQAPNDVLSTPASVLQVFKTVKPNPKKIIIAPNYNHIDLFAGFENDIYVNLPILKYFNEFALPPLTNKVQPQSELVKKKELELEQFVPGVFAGESSGIEDLDNSIF